MHHILDNENLIRLASFLFLFVLMAVLESLWPRRERHFKRAQRWFSNLGIMISGAILARVTLPWVPVAVAYYAQENAVGLEWTPPVVLGVILLDLCIYLQHVAMHHVPWLWRLHRLHHADLDYDVTTGVRFHPIEIVLSLLYKMAIILILGIDPLSVIFFEIMLNGMAMFNHANFKLPQPVDRVLRLVFITPDVHRVHHSSITCETNSNYGFNISLWDRIFGTYRAQPRDGHENMEIGLNCFRNPKQLRFIDMLVQPFRKEQP